MSARVCFQNSLDSFIGIKTNIYLMKGFAVIRLSVINTSKLKANNRCITSGKRDNMCAGSLCMFTHNAVMARWIRPIFFHRRPELLYFNVNKWNVVFSG